MTNTEILAILKFLEETRTPASSILGIETNDSFWRMTIALLRRYFQKNSMTISSLAQAAGVPYATALRHIERMIRNGLLRRVSDERQKKLVYIVPTDALLHNFREYCVLLKNQIGSVFGLSGARTSHFVFGGAHLAARIISAPLKLAPPLGLEGPLRLLLKDEPTFKCLSRLVSEVSVSLETPVTVEMLEYGELRRRIDENFAVPASDYDIVAVDMPWLGRLRLDGKLLALDKYFRRSKANLFDFYAAAWEGAQCRGQVMGVPFAPTAELFLYRKDIFSAHDILPPQTASEVIAAARRLHAPSRGLYGVSWNAARGQPMGQSFIQVNAAFGSPPVSLRKFGGGFDLDTPWEELRPTLDTETGRAAVDYLVQLAEVSPPEIDTMDWTARTAAYSAGITAMGYEWSSRTSQFEEDVRSPARGTTGYLPHPGLDSGQSIAPMGGFVLSIPSNLAPERIEAAWRTIEWLSSPEFTKLLIKNGSPANFRHSVSADPETMLLAPVLRVVDSMEKVGQLQVWPRPPVPNMTTMMQIVGEEVHSAIWRGASKRRALKRAEDRVMRLFDELALSASRKS